MTIWVDADACPGPVKDILYRAAIRTNTNLILVANNFLSAPGSPLIKTVRVTQGFDVADNYIVSHLNAQDLVITADIPLASEVVAKNAFALNPRGELYTEANIKQRLSMRDMMEQLRANGAITGGPSAYGPREKAAFANALDRLLAQAKSLLR